MKSGTCNRCGLPPEKHNYDVRHGVYECSGKRSYEPDPKPTPKKKPKKR